MCLSAGSAVEQTAGLVETWMLAEETLAAKRTTRREER